MGIPKDTRRSRAGSTTIVRKSALKGSDARLIQSPSSRSHEPRSTRCLQDIVQTSRRARWRGYLDGEPQLTGGGARRHSPGANGMGASNAWTRLALAVSRNGAVRRRATYELRIRLFHCSSLRGAQPRLDLADSAS